MDVSEAITVVKEGRVDLVLLDLCFPPDISLGGGWNGLQIMSWLRGLRTVGNAPFIIVTASDPSSIKERALAAGAHAFLEKPIEHAELLQLIKAALLPTPAIG